MTGYTTAPKAYDGFGTRTTAEDCGTEGGRRIRQVHVEEEHKDWQEQRYNSGCHCLWTEQQFRDMTRHPWYTPPVPGAMGA